MKRRKEQKRLLPWQEATDIVPQRIQKRLLIDWSLDVSKETMIQIAPEPLDYSDLDLSRAKRREEDFMRSIASLVADLRTPRY